MPVGPSEKAPLSIMQSWATFSRVDMRTLEQSTEIDLCSWACVLGFAEEQIEAGR